MPKINTHDEPRFWGKTPKFLFVLPRVIQLIIFVYDLYTWEYGFTTSIFNTIFLYMFSLTFLFLTGILAYLYFEIFAELDKLWGTAARELRWNEN